MLIHVPRLPRVKHAKGRYNRKIIVLPSHTATIFDDLLFRPIVRRRQTAAGQEATFDRCSAVPDADTNLYLWPLPLGFPGIMTPSHRPDHHRRSSAVVGLSTGTTSTAILETVVTIVSRRIDCNRSPPPPLPGLSPVTFRSSSGRHLLGPITAEVRNPAWIGPWFDPHADPIILPDPDW